MSVPIYTVDAFTDKPFAGNPAGVCLLEAAQDEDWMQSIAQSWLLYRLTGSATLLGILGFAGSIPILLLAPLAGLWSDRANLHRTMYATQVLEMMQAIALAALAISGAIAPWHIVTLSMIMGVLVAVELPVRHAYLLELVGSKDDLPNAVAVTSLVGNTGRLVGPALAGIVIAAYGEAACFAINALTFVAVLVSFSMSPRTSPTLAPGLGASRKLTVARRLRRSSQIDAVRASPDPLHAVADRARTTITAGTRKVGNTVRAYTRLDGRTRPQPLGPSSASADRRGDERTRREHARFP